MSHCSHLRHENGSTLFFAKWCTPFLSLLQDASLQDPSLSFGGSIISIPPKRKSSTHPYFFSTLISWFKTGKHNQYCKSRQPANYWRGAGYLEDLLPAIPISIFAKNQQFNVDMIPIFQTPYRWKIKGLFRLVYGQLELLPTRIYRVGGGGLGIWRTYYLLFQYQFLPRTSNL